MGVLRLPCGVDASAKHADAKSHQPGFTLVELFAVLGIIGILLGVLLPALYTAREASRKAECKNNLRQIATAFHLHHDSHRHFPTNGWGWTWVGDARRGYGLQQPGGWCFNVLPYLDGNVIHDAARGSDLLQSPVAVYHCPSRRPARLYPFTEPRHPLRNAAAVANAAKTDYAVCSGDQLVHTGSGPTSAEDSVVRRYRWPKFEDATGISYVRTRIRLSEIRDGTSQTAMVGEKLIARQYYRNGLSRGDDQAAFIGDDADNRRWADAPPRRDSRADDIQHFGSAHRNGCHFAVCDGSVRSVSYAVDTEVFKHFGNRQDGFSTDIGK